MPWTLYRYIIKEILKLLLPAAVVVMLLISIAAAIKPLIDGLLEPSMLLRFVAYLAPTMLQFALPFAAMFAATQFFARMAADNEITACSASGLSYFLILVPALVLGSALMVGWYYLSNSLVPMFNKRAAEVVKSDVVRMVVTELQKGRAVRFPTSGNWVVYADHAEERALTPAEDKAWVANGARTLPYRVVRLSGVALSQ